MRGRKVGGLRGRREMDTGAEDDVGDARKSGGGSADRKYLVPAFGRDSQWPCLPISGLANQLMGTFILM